MVWNERVIEDIDISVDSRQVSRALRELEVDTSLRSIEEQIETELTELMKIKGVSRNQATVLRDEGYETPELVSRAAPDYIAQLLSLSSEKASQIIESAKKVKGKKSKSRASRIQPKSFRRSTAKRKSKRRKSK